MKQGSNDDAKGQCYVHFQSASFPTDSLAELLYISAIKNESPNWSGLLHLGDRILSVNGILTIGLTLDEVLNIIKSSCPHLILPIEFDVTKAVVPVTGIFIVKLLKKDAQIGIKIAASRERQTEEPLIVGKVGSIRPVLLLHSIGMDNCTSYDALLDASAGHMRIRTHQDCLKNLDDTVVYTIKINTHGGPLGIIIAGTEEPYDPICITNLTKNGLADRTGIIRIGDEILEINDISLQSKTLNEAIRILKTSGDVITMKMSRYQYFGKFGEKSPIQKSTRFLPKYGIENALSRQDSAIGSWDSHNSIIGAGTSCYQIHAEGNSAFQDPLRQDFSHQQLCNTKNPDISDHWDINEHSHSSSGDGRWDNALEDLQTCGESRLLRQLERSILGVDDNVNKSKSCSDLNEKFYVKHLHETLSTTNLQYSETKSMPVDKDIDEVYIHKPLKDVEQSNCSFRHSICNNSANFCCLPTSSVAMSLPTEIQKVTLCKDQVYEDFGFSVSDGKYEEGVYINSIRPGGPADLSGAIRPLDRILQVNVTKTNSAGLLVPLIASSGDTIEMTVCRPSSALHSIDLLTTDTCQSKGWTKTL